MEPISITGCVEVEPDKYILPIRYAQAAPTAPPQLVEYWQWSGPRPGSERPCWIRVAVMGG